MVRIMAVAIVTALAVVVSNSAQAAIIYSSAGASYLQSFDTLPNTPQNASLGATPAGWKDDDPAPPAGNFSIQGWYLHHPTVQTEGGFNGHQRMRIGAGTSNTGAFMSWGSSGSTERGLGMLSSNTMADLGTTDGNSYYGARLTNNTGRLLTSFTLSYTGEQWRDGGTTTTGSLPQSITFDYSRSATSIEDALATFTDVPLLDFTGPRFGATAGTAYDGNLAANRTAIGPVTVTGINWQAGTDLWIRWTDLNNAGNDHGLGIDDLKFTAEIPEPSSCLLLLLGAIAMLASPRRR
jgi:hypothetical protein